MREISKIIPEKIKAFIRPVFYRVFPMSAKDVKNYWANPSDNNNSPASYAIPIGRSKFLAKILNAHIAVKERGRKKILEIGCNVGRNLNYLLSEGYEDLSGVEISPKAIEAMRKEYPDLIKTAKITISPIEDIIKKIKDDVFDVVFTMAVMEHIHPDSEWIFPEIARIVNQYLITIEDETSPQAYGRYPRNYKNIFEALGLRQIKEINGELIADLGAHFKARIFVK